MPTWWWVNVCWIKGSCQLGQNEQRILKHIVYQVANQLCIFSTKNIDHDGFIFLTRSKRQAHSWQTCKLPLAPQGVTADSSFQSRAQVCGLYNLWRMGLKPRVSSESHERLRQITASELLIQKVWGGVLECSFEIPWWRWHSWSGIPLRESLQQRNPFTGGDRFFS